MSKHRNLNTNVSFEKKKMCINETKHLKLKSMRVSKILNNFNITKQYLKWFHDAAVGKYKI